MVEWPNRRDLEHLPFMAWLEYAMVLGLNVGRNYTSRRLLLSAAPLPVNLNLGAADGSQLPFTGSNSPIEDIRAVICTTHICKL